MKNLYTLCLILVSSGLFSQDYFLKTSCNKKASEIANAAVEHMLNLEMPIALGMAKSALLVDESCGCAQLTISAISSNNDWGSRKTKLSKIDPTSLSKEEKVWYNYQMAADLNERTKIVDAAEGLFPDSPFIAALRGNLNPRDFTFYPEYVKRFPDHSSFAYNMISYGIMYGELGDSDYEQAKNNIDQSIQLHDGPNVYDSNAEHLASLGQYDDALQSQLKAVDYAAWGSVYGNMARIYWMKSNKAEVEKSLRETVDSMMKGIRENDFDAFSEVISEDMQVTMGDSNLGEFYEFSEQSFQDATSHITWTSTDQSDFNFNFAPDMNSVVVTHLSDGSYYSNDSEEIKYATRASHVFARTDDGWKLLHSHWSPRKGAQGIPNRE